MQSCHQNSPAGLATRFHHQEPNFLNIERPSQNQTMAIIHLIGTSAGLSSPNLSCSLALTSAHSDLP
jgi:hypothetical protein